MPLNIPEKLLDKLGRPAGKIGSIIDEYSVLFESSHMTFFPEWTDHGIRHLQETLDTAAGLITADAWELFTEEDALILTLAIIIHDVGMTLTEDQFLSLVARKGPARLISEFDSQSWPEMWEDFSWQVKRFSSKELKQITGSEEPETLTLDPDKWTERQKKLIGEFIRRHHTRLAHEVAVYGTPAVNGSSITFSKLDESFCDLAGVVARSHGMGLRSCYDYLKKRHHNHVSPKNSHPIYLMVLLRIADYLQIDSSRAEKVVIKTRKFRSPLSDLEWKMHHAITDTITHTDDPESIFVVCNPKDTKTYLRLKALLSGLQSELDQSFAALGEVYGRYEDLRNLSIRLRRVRSNLDDVEKFGKDADFVPTHAKFGAVDGQTAVWRQTNYRHTRIDAKLSRCGA